MVTNAQTQALTVPISLLDRLPLAEAVEQEVGRSWKTVPTRTIETALRGHTLDVVEILSGYYRDALALQPADEIQAFKPGGGLRPLSILTFPQRVLYEALVKSAAERLPKYETVHDWDALQSAVLSADDAAYVIHADDAAFFQFVDHELLRSEIINQTGEAELAAALADLLAGLMQRTYGLPQLYPASDVLSEVVIDIAERRMLRRGYAVLALPG